MADDEITRTYSFRVNIQRRQTADYLRANVQPGDALNLEPEANGIAVYHLARHIGYVSSADISRVLYPGIKYASWVNNIEYGDQYISTAINVEVGVYGKERQFPQPAMSHRNPMSRSIDESTSAYRATPVMFRAHPIAFLIAILLIPAIIGIVVLIVWAIISRTTYLEIDNDSVRYETGVFSKDRRALNRRAIRTVRVTQSLLNRMLDVGSIEIFTAGDVPEIRAVSMYQPNEIRELLGK
jgi:membrane protein YdbS with pleckstrin-like domain